MASSVPTLTSVRTNRYEMGSTAAAMLIEAIEGKRPEEPVLDLGFMVIERQSSQMQRPAAGPRAPEWAPAVQNDSVTNDP
jgi:LacI family gluconate utilization system Gnt-I transcriptional repressor